MGARAAFMPPRDRAGADRCRGRLRQFAAL